MEYGRTRKKDRSTVSQNDYIIAHGMLIVFVSYFIYMILPLWAPIAYYERSLERAVLCMTIASAVGISLTHSRNRTKMWMFLNILAGTGIYVVWTIGVYAKGIVTGVVLVLTVVTLYGTAHIFFRRIRTGADRRRILRGRFYTGCLYFWRNAGVASVFIIFGILISLKMTDMDSIQKTYYQKQGYASAYEENGYEIVQRYGDEYSLKANIDTIRPIRQDETWQKLSPSEREKVIEAICYMEARYLGIGYNLKLVFTDQLEEHVGAQYNNDLHTIYYSYRVLSGNNEEAYESIAHEVRHAYQHAVMEVYAKLTPEERNLDCFYGVDKWVRNSMDYVSVETEEELLDYLVQPLEMDARIYARENWGIFLKQMEDILAEAGNSSGCIQ